MGAPEVCSRFRHHGKLTTMKIIAIAAPGGPEALQLADAPDPQPAAGEIVLNVAATAVNRADLLQRQGFYPPPPGAPAWPGLEASDTVAAIGSGVTGWSVGDTACALLAGGGYAEKVAVPVGQLLPVPNNVNLIDAAALPEAACTVWSNLFMLAQLQPGEWLLVHGGSSGIGTMAIQLARSLGAHVAVTAGSAAKLARCRELGAEVLVDYQTQDFVDVVRKATAGRGANVVLDIMGAKYLARNIDVLASTGRVVIIGLQGGAKAEIDLGKLLAKRGSLHATVLRAQSLTEKAAIVSCVREHVWPLIERGEIHPVIHARLPLAEAARAHQLIQDSTHVGKVLLTV
jgi:putative PIG3 family NAD(P)H quinone oxidoreductase